MRHPTSLVRRSATALLTLVAVLHGTAGLYAAPRRPTQSSGSSTSRSFRQARSPVTADRQLLDRYCVTCHNERLRTAGLALDRISFNRDASQTEVWEKVVRKLRSGMMPPIGRPRPESVAVERFIASVEAELDRVAAAHPNPGRTETLHRLSRTEYGHAVRDLLDLEIDVQSLLPADDASYGFDNMAGVLKLNQALLESYLMAAVKISRAAVGSALPVPRSDEFRVPEELRQYEHIEGLPLGTRGGLQVEYTFPRDGEYTVRVDLLCRMAGCDGSAGFADTHYLEVLVDGQRVQQFTLAPHEEDDPEVVAGLKVRLPVKAGRRLVAATFLRGPAIVEVESHRQRLMKPAYMNGNFMQQRWAIYQPFVDKLTITGPFESTGPCESASRRRILSCRPASVATERECARTILRTLARRAYRRPATDDDLHGLIRFYEQGREAGTFDTGIEHALRRLLVSPAFLFRVEADPSHLPPGSNYHLNDIELASRLSFFLWSSIPDDELLTAAVKGGLGEPATLRRQVGRMLRDGRIDDFVRNFVGQWLQIRNLAAHRPSVPIFPDFDDSLREAFRRETELLVERVVKDDKSAVELLTADYSFVNERLALHYGVPNVQGSHFRRVALRDERRGLLGHGSILTVTSRPNRTSPVLRGKWILENLLGTPPPPPPPNVPALAEPADGTRAQGASVRDRLAQHRSNAACANCHAAMDPLGFALENFDGTGRWRERDEAGNAIDASGVLANGVPFENYQAFRAALLRSREQFVTALTERLLTYALGRGLEAYDMPSVRRIVRDAAADDYRMHALIVGITMSVPFRMRRTSSAAAEGTSASRSGSRAETVKPKSAARMSVGARR